MTAYWHIAAAAYRRRISSFTEQFGRSVLFVIILTAWWNIWKQTAFGGFRGFAPADGLWYLAGSEWIVLSVPTIYMEIEADVRSGDIAYSLQRPVSYAGYHVAQAMGLGAASWTAAAIVGGTTAYLLTGQGPNMSLTTFAAVAALTLGAVFTLTLVMVTLGLLSVWTNDASPCAWVWQKLHFVLGGLMLPLMIYPEALRRVASWTPFPALLGNVSEPFVSGTGIAFLPVAGSLFAWAAVFAAVLALVFARAVRRIQEG